MKYDADHQNGAPILDLNSLDLVVTPGLPGPPPSASEDTRRIVRHGLADWIRYAGDEVGPKPGDRTHAVLYGRTMFVSQEMHDRFVGAMEAAERLGGDLPFNLREMLP